jgi:hypothetical protein
MRTTSRTLALIAAGALAGACSDDGGSPVPLAEATGRYARVMCERTIECNAFAAVLLSQTTCDFAEWSLRNGELRGLADLVASGRVAYDGDAMATCLDDLASLPCVELSSTGLADVATGGCAEAIAGQVAAGGACERTLECQAGSYCETGMSCPGTCQPRVAAAGACSGDEACATGLDCASGRCAAFGQTGAACGTGAPSCAMGFVCDSDRMPASCQPLTNAAASGAACNPAGGVFCQPGLVCALVDVDAEVYQCQAPVAAGAACFRAVPNACPRGQVCVVAAGQDAGACTPQGAVGQPCAQGAGVVFGCVSGSNCDGDTDLCVALADNGAACTSDAQCVEDCLAGACGLPGACD